MPEAELRSALTKQTDTSLHSDWFGHIHTVKPVQTVLNFIAAADSSTG